MVRQLRTRSSSHGEINMVVRDAFASSSQVCQISNSLKIQIREPGGGYFRLIWWKRGYSITLDREPSKSQFVVRIPIRSPRPVGQAKRHRARTLHVSISLFRARKHTPIPHRLLRMSFNTAKMAVTPLFYSGEARTIDTRVAQFFKIH